MKKIFLFPVFIVISLSIFISANITTNQANAVVGSQFKAGRIIDDGIFFNGYSMDAGGIQAFLNAKVPTCDTQGTQPYNGSTRAAYGIAHGAPPPYTCLKSYQQTISAKGQDAYCGYVGGGTKSAAQIIFDVAVACNISPKVLIVLLQKEQALVTDDWPFPVQYQSATGFGCPDTAACDSTYYGFFNQVYNAARQYQRYAKQSASYNFRAGRVNNIQYNPNASCGSSGVFIENQATAGLYNYTPYQPNASALNNLYGSGDSCGAYGNRNFWRQYSDWFGSPVANGLPSSASLYAASPSGKLYVSIIGDGGSTYYHIPAWDVLTAYNLTNGPIVAVSDDYIASSGTNGGELNTTYSPKGSGGIFLADQGRGFHVPSWQICTDWNLTCGNAPELPLEFTNWLSNAGELPSMFINQNVAYKPVNAVKQPFGRVDDIFDSGYSWNNFVQVQDINANIPLGTPILVKPTAVKFGSNPAIYYFDGSQYLSVPTLDLLTSWGLGNNVLLPPNSSYNTTPPTTTTSLSSFSSTTDGTKYMVNGGQKIQLDATAQAYWPSATYTSLNTALGNLPSGQLKSFVGNGPSVYLLDSSSHTKRSVLSYGDLLALGYNNQNITYLTSADFNAIATGAPKILDGNTVGIQETGGVYVLSGGQLLHVPDWGTLSAYRINLNNLISAPASIASTYTYNGDLSTTARDSSNYYIFYNGNSYRISPALASDLGVKIGSYQLVNDTVIRNAAVSKTASKFFLNQDNGKIYYGSGGGIHYVTTYKAYVDYGGNSQPVIPVNTAIINSFTIGPDV
jgi:hypothetical protein